MDLVQDQTITGKISSNFLCSLPKIVHIHLGTSGKYLLRHMLDNPSTSSPKDIAVKLQLVALTFNGPETTSSSSLAAISELETLCRTAIADLPSEVEAFRSGNKNVLNKILGHVMKKSRGRADAKAVRHMVEKLVLVDTPNHES